MLRELCGVRGASTGRMAKSDAYSIEESVSNRSGSRRGSLQAGSGEKMG
jgi:hypothetical protein